jgi:hypothetical protein
MSALAYTYMAQADVLTTKRWILHFYWWTVIYIYIYIYIYFCRNFQLFIFPLQVKNKPHYEVAKHMFILELGVLMNNNKALFCSLPFCNSVQLCYLYCFVTGPFSNVPFCIKFRFVTLYCFVKCHFVNTVL